MITAIYLWRKSPENLLAEVDLEVVPRGIYVIDGVAYHYVGQPTFFIEKKAPPFEGMVLSRVELIVERHAV